jgi:putative DNA primase/helicase
LLLIVLGALVARRLFASNVTPAVLFRTIEKYSPVLLIDEADTFVRDNDELRGVLNSGHTRTTAVAIRAVGDDHEPRAFSTWCAKAIALIGRLPGTLADRAIEIPMRRRTADESIERLRQDRIEGVCHAIRRQAARWASDHVTELQAADPAVPEALNDRAADCWRPLLAIADQLGGEWPAQARLAAKALSRAGDVADEDIKVQLLADCHPYVTKHNATSIVPTKGLLAHLHGLEDRPWNEWGRQAKPITSHTIAKLLKDYDIHPTSDRAARGYRADAFQDAFDRYLPHDPAFKASERKNHNRDGSETPISKRQSGNAVDTLKSDVSSINTGVSDGLTDQTPDQGSVHEREDRDAERI